MITEKIIPQTRMVTSGVGGPTYRLGLFIDSLLKPVVSRYCNGELIKDTTEFIRGTLESNTNGDFVNYNYVGTLDVDALYPSIKRDLALIAVGHALETSSNYLPQERAMIIDLVKLCLENSVVHYRNEWYLSLDGLPTGGSESSSIANIYVKWGLDEVILKHPEVCAINRMKARKRFLDDLWFVWGCTTRKFELFKTKLNEVGKNID